MKHITNHRAQVMNNIVSSFQKGIGEGSRGGVVIAHTKSGTPIYAPKGVKDFHEDSYHVKGFFANKFDSKHEAQIFNYHKSHGVKIFARHFEDSVTEDIPHSDIHPTQRKLFKQVLKEKIAGEDENKDIPFGYKTKDGKVLLLDGHHRIATNTLLGNTSSKVKIKNLY